MYDLNPCPVLWIRESDILLPRRSSRYECQHMQGEVHNILEYQRHQKVITTHCGLEIDHGSL